MRRSHYIQPAEVLAPLHANVLPLIATRCQASGLRVKTILPLRSNRCVIFSVSRISRPRLSAKGTLCHTSYLGAALGMTAPIVGRLKGRRGPGQECFCP